MTTNATGLSEKLLGELKAGILIAYRMKNHALDYSIMNRPEPTLSGVDDHMLATALLFAGNKFKFVHDAGLNGGKVETVSRDDARTVNYNEFIDISFSDGTITSTRRIERTLEVLEAVIGDIVRKAGKPMAALVPSGKSN